VSTTLNKTADKKFKKRIIGLILGIIIIALFVILPPFSGLAKADSVTNPEAAMASIGVFIGAIVMFVCETAPLAVVSLSLMMILPYFNITDLNTIYAKFGGTSFFFVAFCFGITGALSQTTIPLRIAAFITRISKGRGKVIVYGFGLATGILSAILSNFGTMIMMYGFVLMFLRQANCKPGQSNLGRDLMMVVPMAAGAGGIATPAGSPGNLIAQSLFLEAGVDMNFLQWTIMWLPWCIISIIVFCLFCCLIFKPENLSVDDMSVVADERDKAGPMNGKEKLAVLIIAVTVILWFAGSFVKALNTTVVAGIAFFVMFMPGVDLMNWKAYVQEADWNLLFMVGSVAITMGCVNDTGAMLWIAKAIFGGLTGMSTFVIVLIIAAVISYLRVFVPTAPSVAAIFVPIMLAIATVTGISPVVLGMFPVFVSGSTMTLMYTEPIYVYTFGSGYYTAGDLFKAGLAPTWFVIIAWAALCPLWVKLFGY
jgi:sodium-dependent dicarboxylate transporter 2/3/5